MYGVGAGDDDVRVAVGGVRAFGRVDRPLQDNAYMTSADIFRIFRPLLSVQAP